MACNRQARVQLALVCEGALLVLRIYLPKMPRSRFCTRSKGMAEPARGAELRVVRLPLLI